MVNVGTLLLLHLRQFFSQFVTFWLYFVTYWVHIVIFWVHFHTFFGTFCHILFHFEYICYILGSLTLWAPIATTCLSVSSPQGPPQSSWLGVINVAADDENNNNNNNNNIKDLLNPPDLGSLTARCRWWWEGDCQHFIHSSSNEHYQRSDVFGNYMDIVTSLG